VTLNDAELIYVQITAGANRDRHPQLLWRGAGLQAGRWPATGG
jgi:hypothetical protein